MYDMELQHELAVFLLRLCWAEGWNDYMLGAWIRETFHASSWENVIDQAGEVNRKMEDFGFQLGSLSQLQQCVCLVHVSQPIVKHVEHE